MAPQTDTAPPFVVTDLPGPQWLRDRRVVALDRAGHLPVPTGEAEEWRYSRIAALDLSRYAAPEVASDDLAVPSSVDAALAGLGARAGAVVLVDGRVVRTELDDSSRAAGVRFGSSHDEALDARELLGEPAEHPVDLFAAWNEGLSVEPVVVAVPAGVVVDRPLVVVSHVGSDGRAVFPRLSVHLGEGARASVVEVHVSSDVEALVVPVTDVDVAADAELRHAVVQDLGRRVWQVASFAGRVDRDATLVVAAAALGGDYARLRMDCHLVGRGATGNLSSVYLGDRDQMLDLRTFQVHDAPDTSSNLLFKGGVAGTSHSVYTGLIRIAPGARGSNAFQTNRNLKLSDGAWAESVPNLEIQNNDVHCSHASTVGPVDPDQRFYLESRGVPTNVADRLVVGGFFDEVLDDFAVPSAVEEIRARLDATLDEALGRVTAGSS